MLISWVRCFLTCFAFYSFQTSSSSASPLSYAYNLLQLSSADRRRLHKEKTCTCSLYVYTNTSNQSVSHTRASPPLALLSFLSPYFQCPSAPAAAATTPEGFLLPLPPSTSPSRPITNDDSCSLPASPPPSPFCTSKRDNRKL